jgi:hypothetical protein
MIKNYTIRRGDGIYIPPIGHISYAMDCQSTGQPILVIPSYTPGASHGIGYGVYKLGTHLITPIVRSGDERVSDKVQLIIERLEPDTVSVKVDW